MPRFPSQFKPVDLVVLGGARLRVLTGGKSKWDLKRSFGIVESAGKIRFFVVASDDEYTAWTREIEKVIRHQSPSLKEGSAAIGQREATIGDDHDSLQKVSSDRDEESVGVASSGPLAADSVQSDLGGDNGTETQSKVRGKLAGLGNFLKKSKEDATTTMKEPEAVEETIAFADQDSPGECGGDTSPTAEGSTLPQGDNPGNTSRRVHLKGKVAGVGQATGRWGSALIAKTRQKGREVAERTRRVATSNAGKGEELTSSGHNTLHVITEKEDERNWTCPKCTYINSTMEIDADFVICAMCESPTEVNDVEFEHASEAVEEAKMIESEEPPVSTEASSCDPLGTTDPGEDVFRRQTSEPIEARDRVNSVDSDPDIFRRSQSAGSFGNFIEEDETSIISDLAMDETSEAARTGGRRRRDRLGSLLGSGRKSRPV
jgi:hypothetical protein